MTRHSSYSAPRSERPSGPQGGQRGRSSKRNTYNRRSWKDNRTLFILVCFILPFIALNLIIVFLAVSTPRIEYNISDTTDYKTVDLSIKIHSPLPLKKMSVTLESQPIHMVREKGVYKTTLTENGTLEILATGWNGMTTRAYEHVATLDDASPSIDQDNYVMENDQLTVIASDSQSGVNYDASYGVDANGTTVKPTTVNQETGEITFPMDTASLTVYIEDFAGNTFKASFTNRTVGIDTGSRNTQFPSDGKNGTNGNTSIARDSSDAKKTAKSTDKTKDSAKSATSTGKAKDSAKSATSTDKTKDSAKSATSTDKAKDSAKAAKSTDKAKDSAKSATSTDKAKDSAKSATSTDKTKDSAKSATSTDKSKASAKAATSTDKAKETTRAATEASKPAQNAPAEAPSLPTASGGGESGAQTAPPQTSRPGMPGGGSNDVTVVPLQ